MAMFPSLCTIALVARIRRPHDRVADEEIASTVGNQLSECHGSGHPDAERGPLQSLAVQ
jgi:hypothetical protein